MSTSASDTLAYQWCSAIGCNKQQLTIVIFTNYLHAFIPENFQIVALRGSAPWDASHVDTKVSDTHATSIFRDKQPGPSLTTLHVFQTTPRPKKTHYFRLPPRCETFVLLGYYV